MDGYLSFQCQLLAGAQLPDIMLEKSAAKLDMGIPSKEENPVVLDDANSSAKRQHCIAPGARPQPK